MLESKINRWFQERKDMFVRDLVSQFLEAKIFFDGLYRYYKESGKIEFKDLDFWVSTEVKKGPLWRLKDDCHSLFRNTTSKVVLCEYLLDWTLGSIFHESMKLKEDVYQLEAYRPEYEKIEPGKFPEPDILDILKEYYIIVDKAQEDMAEEIERINFLFSKASQQLKKLLPNYSQNGLLVRFLLENEGLVAAVLGEGSLREIFTSMYQRGLSEAHYVAAKNYLGGGWYEEAAKNLEKALEINPDYIEVKEALAEIKKGRAQHTST